MARAGVLFLALGLPGATLVPRWLGNRHAIVLEASMPEAGGWQPRDLTAAVGEPLHLRLTSEDVIHGFAIGQMDQPAVEVKPGQVTDLQLIFDRPGTYTFFCTRWCGPNHWRMRGTIEVTGPGAGRTSKARPPYMRLGVDLDAPHAVDVELDRMPSAQRGELLNLTIPDIYLERDSVRTQSPLAVWRALRDIEQSGGLSDAVLWDFVARIWRRSTTDDALRMGEELYAENCAACHGETGRGDGVMARVLQSQDVSWSDGSMEFGHEIEQPANFADLDLLGASPVLLQGKILRGGMGTGMPYWGPIFTDAQVWALVDHLWRFQFIYNEEPAR
jgi:mono/diheme cytochrome c family protein/plastocyanin